MPTLASNHFANQHVELDRLVGEAGQLSAQNLMLFLYPFSLMRPVNWEDV